MVATSHLSNDGGEFLELHLLGRENRVALEERNHALEQVVAIAHDEDECSITFAVRSDVAATKSPTDQLQHLSPVTVLADMKLRNQLKPDATGRVALHRDREASFSVDVTRDVAIQPFLLIVRTRHVVTIVNVRSDVTMSSAGYSEFPAYSQIYRQQWSTVSRRSEPSSRTALMGEQPNPWDLLQPQDATSRHRT